MSKEKKEMIEIPAEIQTTEAEEHRSTGLQLSPIAAGMIAVQRRQEAIQHLIKVGIPLTSKSSWIDMDGKPFMDSNACEKIARLAGISFRFSPPVKIFGSDEQGDFYIYHIYGEAFIGSEVMAELGSCSSRDKFLGRAHGSYKPLSEVDEAAVIKKAIANFKGRAVKALLGIDGLTWEDLQKIDPTLTPENTTKVDFSKSKDDGVIDPKTGLSMGDLRRAIGNILLEITNGDKEAAGQKLAELTSFAGKDGKVVPGKTSAKAISDKQAPITYENVKKLYKDTFGVDYEPKKGGDA